MKVSVNQSINQSASQSADPAASHCIKPTSDTGSHPDRQLIKCAASIIVLSCRWTVLICRVSYFITITTTQFLQHFIQYLCGIIRYTWYQIHVDTSRCNTISRTFSLLHTVLLTFSFTFDNVHSYSYFFVKFYFHLFSYYIIP